jgi:arylsulfatase A-like enzyme
MTLARALLRAAGAVLAFVSFASAADRRVVIVKVDGMPADLVQEVMRERDPKTGRTRLPWIEEVFARQGTRIENFYVRGISLSAPSWAMLDTGYHQRIHGNVEYDRVTLRAYDYLNFFPFYFSNAEGHQADMPGVQVLDASGVPLIIDRFPWAQRYQSFQLYQRWIRWKTLQRSLQNRFTNHSPRDLLDEWVTGFEFAGGIEDQTERELIAHLQDPNYLYLDYYTGDVDHVMHLNNDRQAQIDSLQRVDALIGRVWTAIQKSPLADRTVFALVSDHGMNSVEGIFSQGYSLVDWFRSKEGGAHHTATDRYPMDEYKLRGLNFMVSEVITPSPDATYLKGESQQYPTAYLDLDGNERAAVQLRNSDLNALHILLLQLSRKDLPKRLRPAASQTFFDIVDARKQSWQRSLASLQDELGALHRSIVRERAYQENRPQHKWTEEEINQGLEQVEHRRLAKLLAWEQDEKTYRAYSKAMFNLLALKRTTLESSAIHIEDLIPKRSLGEPNTLFDLRNYVAGPTPEGFVVTKDTGTRLDEVESFRHVDYFSALRRIVVRNNTQKGIGPRPIDFVATRVPVPNTDEAVWMYADDDHQALVMGRQKQGGGLELRYLPVTNLHGLRDGSVAWSDARFKTDLPLRVWEDSDLRIPNGQDRETWLGAWHTDREWLNAVHRTRYSNGLIGIFEQFVREQPLSSVDLSASPADAALLLQFEARRRRMVEPDMLLLANDHWNFNARNFNPGGNHGSFFRISTHSVLMFASGSQIGVPQGVVIQEPYDSLSFAPTLLKLAGYDVSGLPGPVIGF